MRKFLFVILSLFLGVSLYAQKAGIYVIAADSVKLTSCDSSELIVENHTQNVPGFLFNTGRGRTVFKRAVQKLNDSLYLIGADTLVIPPPKTNFWSLNGNANTDPATNFIGTTDATPLVFGSYSGEHMRMFPNGDFGLGTLGTDHGYNLQVMGDDGIYAPGIRHIFGNIAITGNTDANSAGMRNGIRSDSGIGSTMIFEGNAQGWAYDMFSFTTTSGNGPKALYYQNGSIVKIGVGFGAANVPNLSGNTLFINPTYNIDTSHSSSWPMTLRGIYYDPVLNNIAGSRHIAIETVTGDVLLGTTSGNTGIGTNSPTAQLHTTGSVRFAGLTQDSTKTNILVSDADGNLYYRSASSLAADNLIRSSLAVNGPITARKLTLSSETNWPDYVFDSTYQLKPLSEVAAYLRQEHHLPGIPAAAEIQKQGLDVGASQAALLEKIEELTLYNIDQARKLEEQANVLDHQNQRLQDQEKQIEKLCSEMSELKQSISSQTTDKQ